MARLLLKPHNSSRHYLSLLRASMASSSFSCSHSFSFLSRPSVSFNSRVSFPARRVPSRFLVQNGVSPRAFMSTSVATESQQESAGSKAYGSDQIQVLKGLEPVRKRPGMYIGSTGPRGLHHLVYEILDNAVDEAQAGYASTINVVLHSDNSVSITDNGRGIPTDLHPETKKSALETVLTVLHAGGKFGGSNSGYRVSGGLHGVGLSVVNALSEELEVTVWRDGKQYQQKYSRGNPVTTLTCHELPVESKERRGTLIKFWPDKEVFTTEIQFDYHTIAGRVRELAFLNPKLTISLQKEDNDPEKNQFDEHFYAGGLVEYVNWLNTDKKPLHDVLGFRKEVDGIAIDMALQWCSDAYSDTILGYANSIRTVDGGTHIDGAKASLTRTLNNLGKKSKVIKNYSAWAFQFQIFVKGKELWGHIAGTVPAPDSEQEKEKYVKWEVKDAQIMSWILGSMEHSMLLNLKPYKSSREMWDYLKKVYNQSNTARRFQLELELGQLSQGSMSIQEFYSSFVNLWAEYTDIVYASVPPEGLIVIQSVHETSKRDQFLMKLRGEFEAIRSNLMNRQPVPFLDICVGELLREEQRIITQAVLEQKAQTSTPIPVAYTAQGRSKGGRNMSNVQCYSCKGFGHIATTCTKKFCNYCKKTGHIIKDCSIRPPKKSETAYNVSVGSSNTPSPGQSSITPEMVQQMIVSALSALGLSGSSVREDDREGT